MSHREFETRLAWLVAEREAEWANPGRTEWYIMQSTMWIKAIYDALTSKNPGGILRVGDFKLPFVNADAPSSAIHSTPSESRSKTMNDETATIYGKVRWASAGFMPKEKFDAMRKKMAERRTAAKPKRPIRKQRR